MAVLGDPIRTSDPLDPSTAAKSLLLELDSATLTAAANGNPVAIEAVVARFYPELTNFATRQGADDPEGTVNLVLSTTLAKLGELRQLTDPVVRAYLYRSIRWTLRRERAQAKGYLTTSLDEQHVEPDMDRSEPIADRMMVDRLLNELSSRDRELITRRFLLDQEYSQIATDLDLDQGTARKATSRAVGRLRALIAAVAMVTVAVIVLRQAGLHNVSEVDTSPADSNLGPAPALVDSESLESNAKESSSTIGPAPDRTDDAPVSGPPPATVPGSTQSDPQRDAHAGSESGSEAPSPARDEAAGPGGVSPENPLSDPHATSLPEAPAERGGAAPTPSTTTPGAMPSISMTPHTVGPCFFVFVSKSDRPTQVVAYGPLGPSGEHIQLYLDGVPAGQTRVVSMPAGFNSIDSRVTLVYVDESGEFAGPTGFFDIDAACGSELVFDPPPGL